MRKMTIEEMEEKDALADIWIEEQRLSKYESDTTKNDAKSDTESL